MIWKILSEICGGIALILCCVGFFGNKKFYLVLQAIADIFYAFSYFFIDAFVAGFVTIIAILKSILFIIALKKGWKKTYLIVIGIILLNIVVTIAFFSGPLDIIPFITSTLYVFVCYVKNMQLTRVLSMIPNGMLLVYNIILCVFTNTLMCAIEMIATIISLFKKDKIDQNAKSNISKDSTSESDD